MKRPRHPRRAFSLLAVLWCLGIMSLVVGGLILCVSMRLDEHVAANEEAQARRLALSGLAVGLHPLIERGDPLLVQETKQEGYRVELTGEGGRLNINFLLQNGRTDILDRFWALCGLKSAEAQALDDCLLDWIDTGDLKHLNGAKREDYARLGFPDYPPGRPFQTIDEMAAVLGFSAVVKGKPDWRRFFTLWGDGRIDLKSAPPEVLSAVGNVSLDSARAFVAEREQNEANSLPAPWQSAEEAAVLLGMSRDDLQKTSPLLTLQSSLWRIESTGRVGKRKRVVSVVVQKNGGATSTSPGGIDYYLWREF